MDSQKISYYNEISLMMFGFGDSHTPNPETVRLVESIVLSQLRLIVQEGLKHSENNTLKGEHLVFLMRKNKVKMRRFVKYLQHKDMKKHLDSDVVDLTDKPKPPLLTFIEKMDEFGELMDTNEFDEVKHQRQLRADRISLALDEQKYIKFAKARCASFNSKEMSQTRNFEKLRQWIDPKKEVNFTTNSFDVLAYYAYETVAQIADFAFLARLDNRRTGDPLGDLSGLYYTGSMFNGEHRFTGLNPDYSRVYNGQPPFSVNEIKEVMRRIFSPQAGKLCLGRKNTESICIIAV
ncbi:transcription initiation protein SPT3 homolog [Onthophagus taurus]|uniref:transcription initiation protein SPT3 homolog n=1 Tax=Onthophagus taurus TaxID=166361 RepID=UPI000C20C883|nr:transcription initiation protein SPT3 homolog [Onthophagus taurus]